MIRPATSVMFHVETTRHRPDNSQIGEVVRSTFADVWREHWQPMVGYRVTRTIDGVVRRFRIVGVELVEDMWCLAVTEAVRVEEAKP